MFCLKNNISIFTDIGKYLEYSKNEQQNDFLNMPYEEIINRFISNEEMKKSLLNKKFKLAFKLNTYMINDYLLS